MRQVWMLISVVSCLLLGISAGRIQKTVSPPENRHLRFSNSYYLKLKDEFAGNLATSPLGVDELLLMITFGADYHHRTYKQLNDSVHLPLKESDFYTSHQSVIDLLNQNATNVELKIKNRMYVKTNAGILQLYRDNLDHFFGAECTEVDFGNPTKAANRINNEIASLTQNKIKNAISSNGISRSTWMVLMNVLYFKGKWKTPFKKSSTKLRPFHQNENLWKNVSTMYLESDFKWFRYPEIDATVVEIPYQNQDFSMIVILPNENVNLNQVERKLQLPALWGKLADSVKEQIDLYLPKFKIESSLNLKPILEKMGITDLFSSQANLSQMTSMKNAHVSRVHQKVSFEVNEEGSEAAAVTTSFVPLSLDPDFKVVRVDRPFLAILRYKDVNLFMARITDPRF